MRRFILMAGVLVLLAGACSAPQDPSEAGAGTPKPAGLVSNGPWTTTQVAGLPVADGPNGLRKDGPAPTSKAENTDGGELDRVALAALDDVQAFWKANFPGQYVPVKRVLSYSSTDGGPTACGEPTKGVVNAFYCSSENTVAWDRAVLLPLLDRKFGELSIATVLAHEIGHSVQFQLKDVTGETPQIIAEQQADCYAGAFFRSIAEGGSERFQVSTGSGLNQILQTLFFVRDAPGKTVEGDRAHGNAFDRVTAFQEGFGDGFTRCRKIDEAEIKNRVTEQSESQAGAQDANGADLTFDADASENLESTLREQFGKDVKAQLTVGLLDCPSAKQTKPASYCPDTGILLFDTDAVVAMAKPLDKGGSGDFAAFAELASRFTLAVQKAAGLKLTGEAAAQRTACLTGTWAASIKPGQQRALQLSPGDLDEAIGEMLGAKSLIAADVDGTSVPSGFARVKAFRAGFSEGTVEACEKAYP